MAWVMIVRPMPQGPEVCHACCQGQWKPGGLIIILAYEGLCAGKQAVRSIVATLPLLEDFDIE